MEPAGTVGRTRQDAEHASALMFAFQVLPKPGCNSMTVKRCHDLHRTSCAWQCGLTAAWIIYGDGAAAAAVPRLLVAASSPRADHRLLSALGRQQLPLLELICQ